MGSSNIVSLAPIPDTADVKLSRFVVNGGATIAGVANQRIFVFGAYFSPATGATIVPYDGGTVAQSGTIALATGIPFVLPYQQYPWWTAAVGNSLVLSVSGTVGGEVLYVQG
jgi:hypothetical protein